ncbi:MAG: UDP-N-acetylglucosamine 2-epimerase (non-hydrolyzing) [Caulobacteraceae bacterium]
MIDIQVMSIVGTRPEAIKMAPVIQELARTKGVTATVCATGQHRQMLDPVLSLFNIKPDFDLDVMRPGQDLTDVTCGVLTGLRDVLKATRPNLLLVQGDTSTAMTAALAAFYEKIPVGHVEAGLRTQNLYSPWPEEGNRRLISAIAELHFPPTELSRDALLREGIDPANVFMTGNTVIDALLQVIAGIDSDPDFVRSLLERYPFLEGGPGKRHMILVTGHRRESFGGGFESICQALNDLARRDDVEIVYPVHLNPNVREPVFRLLGGLPNVHLLEPLDYRPFVYFMKRARLILTDSGGIQEEAPSLNTPVLVMRDVTERSEALGTGLIKLVGTDRAKIVSEAEKILDQGEAGATPARPNPYGDGQARGRIVSTILSRFGAPSAATAGRA